MNFYRLQAQPRPNGAATAKAATAFETAFELDFMKPLSDRPGS
jgi:hypothetical protein